MVTTYAHQATIFEEQAQEELKKGDLRQASEKGWGAAAQIIKAVAQNRGWEHSYHNALYNVVSRLSEESGDNDIVLLFSSAESLHQNFYEGRHSHSVVALHLLQVSHLVEKLRRYADW